MLRRSAVAIVSVIALVALSSRWAAAAAGDLDPSFGQGGRVRSDYGTGQDGLNDLALQPDGKIVAVGQVGDGISDDFIVVRYLTDGTLDPTFGNGGLVVTSFSRFDDIAAAVAIAPNGKIVVAGYAYPDEFARFAVARYLPDGQLDARFSGNGRLLTDFPRRFSANAFDVAIGSSGRIVVAGGARRALGCTSFAVAAYHPNGTPDDAFSGDGRRVINFRPKCPEASSVAIQGGRVVLAGGSGVFALARLTWNGTLDGSFGGDGRVTTPFLHGGGASALAIQPDGNLVVAGSDPNGQLAVARYGPGGALDPTFSNDGIQVVPGVGRGVDVTLESDGKIVTTADDASVDDFVLVRLGAAGDLDSTFGVGGVVVTDFHGRSDHARAVTIQADGRVLAAGITIEIDCPSGECGDGALTRYLAS
jgi:uncharacterized delta-60 repeat protein